MYIPTHTDEEESIAANGTKVVLKDRKLWKEVHYSTTDMVATTAERYDHFFMICLEMSVTCYLFLITFICIAVKSLIEMANIVAIEQNCTIVIIQN